jgi:serine/threonine protein kinase/class 3 adenylate cyclase
VARLIKSGDKSPHSKGRRIMNLGLYRLVGQLGAGADGVSYRACDDVGPVEVRVLSGARTERDRWKRLVKRLRLAAMLDHPAAADVLQINLDNDPPYIALEWLEGENLASRLKGEPLSAFPQRACWIHKIAAVLAAAHRIGLAHGRLRPSAILTTSAGKLKIDFTGTDCSSAPEGEWLRVLDASCQAPEQIGDGIADPAGDVYSLGAILFFMITGRSMETRRSSAGIVQLADLISASQAELPVDFVAELQQLVRETTAAEPAERLSAKEVADRLSALVNPDAPTALIRATGAAAVTGDFVAARSSAATGEFLPGSNRGESVAALPTDVSGRERLGRFRLIEKLGEGGMGAVYRAEDVTDGTIVAVKVLGARSAREPEALRRFLKEARLLAEVNNPYVTNLLEVNEDGDIHYLAIEFVAGKPLSDLLAERGQLDERVAVAIMADVARALVDAHPRGIVHRDIKPGNILLVTPELSEPLTTHDSPLTPPRVKLSDFGLARHVVESESLAMTGTGAILGTPYYMSPEQCSGSGAIGPAADVYAMGATLFHLLAGRPPFVADNPLNMIAMHCNEPPPALQKLNPALSDGVCQIVGKALAKHPDLRYPNAAALLRDLERLLRGEPTSIVAHPRLPACDAAKTVQFEFTWDLEASPQQLWPHVSNTDRLNRAVGLSDVQFTSHADPTRGVRRFGQFHKAGMAIGWEEHPFEWIEARRMGVLREFSRGPFKWFVSVTELVPRARGGTTLTHSVRIEPSGLLGRTVAAVEVGIRARRALERVYRRIDAAVTGKLGRGASVDPFEEPSGLSAAQRRRLDQLLDKLAAQNIDPTVIEQLGDFIAQAPDQAVARIRPLALASRLGLDPDQVVAACLTGAREGLLVLLWDILCPVCRIPSEVKDTLRALREHGHCEACNLDFELDFANSVEMIFRAHPEIRHVELGTYCVGGPAHSPHVVAQVRVGSGERIELELALSEGAYRLRGPQLPFGLDLRVFAGARASLWELSLGRAPEPDLIPTLKTGGQVLALTNDHEQELLVRVERSAPRHDALTAARASSLALFRALFPNEILSPGQLINVATVTLLVTDLDQAGGLYQELGDARAFGLLHEHFRLLNERIRREGGALIKTIGEGLLAAFSESAAAVRAGLDLQSVLGGSPTTRDLRLRVGVHRGEAMAATINERLDYFGTTVNVALKLPQLARGGELLLTQAVTADPQVAALLRDRKLDSELVQLDVPGLRDGLVHRLRNRDS